MKRPETTKEPRQKRIVTLPDGRKTIVYTGKPGPSKYKHSKRWNW